MLYKHKLIGRRQTSPRDSHADMERKHGVSERKEKERKKEKRGEDSLKWIRVQSHMRCRSHHPTVTDIPAHKRNVDERETK